MIHKVRAKMSEILELTKQAGMGLRLARVKPAVFELLKRDGFLDRIGENRAHGNVFRAIEIQMGSAEVSDPATVIDGAIEPS